MSTAQINLRLRFAFALSLFVHSIVLVFVLTFASSSLQPPPRIFVSLHTYEHVRVPTKGRQAKARLNSGQLVRSFETTSTVASADLEAADNTIAEGVTSQVGAQGARPSRIIDALYTQRARSRGIEGTVALEITVGIDGRVKNARIKQGLGYGLDEACLEAILQSTFETATDRFGKPREEQLVHKYRFQLLNRQ